mmetsp:Transcript_29346/g.68724  ORF Transcript_29346/g.68724 Transcript_29346/m.68724 type:complete len:222 (-) Transcript_29346:92-757(-)
MRDGQRHEQRCPGGPRQGARRLPPHRLLVVWRGARGRLLRNAELARSQPGACGVHAPLGTWGAGSGCEWRADRCRRALARVPQPAPRANSDPVRYYDARAASPPAALTMTTRDPLALPRDAPRPLLADRRPPMVPSDISTRAGAHDFVPVPSLAAHQREFADGRALARAGRLRGGRAARQVRCVTATTADPTAMRRARHNRHAPRAPQSRAARGSTPRHSE